MSMRVVKVRPQTKCLDISGLTPRVQRIITLVLRDAELINACDSGSVEYHFTRLDAGESVKPKITLHPGTK
jgi:hypothetical protein